MNETRSYFTDGQAYERLMGRWSRAVGEVFLDWLAPAKDQKWLDVGCGTGAFTDLVLQRCAPSHISGIDPAEAQLGFARGRLKGARADFRVGDAQSLPFAGSSFDVAAMALVISFIPDAAKAVAEMRRVVRPGGAAAAYMWDGLGGGSIQQPIYDALTAMNVAVPASPLRKNSHIDAMARLFEGAGLAQVATRVIEIQVSFPNFDDYWSTQTALANTAVQAMQRLSAADLARLKDDLRRRLPTDRDGRIAYAARANAVKGRVPG